MSTDQLIEAIERIRFEFVAGDHVEGIYYNKGCDACIALINKHVESATNQIKADGIREALNNVERTFTLQHKDASILGAPATVDYHALLKYARMLSISGSNENE